MKDSRGNEIRYYKVVYTRNMQGGKRLKAHVIAAEQQLQQMLYDFQSRYAYIVESAELLVNYQPPIEETQED